MYEYESIRDFSYKYYFCVIHIILLCIIVLLIYYYILYNFLFIFRVYILFTGLIHTLLYYFQFLKCFCYFTRVLYSRDTFSWILKFQLNISLDFNNNIFLRNISLVFIRILRYIHIYELHIYYVPIVIISLYVLFFLYSNYSPVLISPIFKPFTKTKKKK